MDSSHPPTLDYKSATTATAVPPLAVRVGLPLAIAFVLLAFVVSVAILYYRSVLMAPASPEALVVVRGEEYHKGAQVRLESPAVAFNGSLEPANQYTCSFRVPPGQYQLRVSLSGVTLLEGTLPVGEHQYRCYTVPRTKKSAGPTTGRS